ncbi:CTNA protein, partial [Bombycilla garrulus]|nr:CTNA protein [Bombycilla garrulus]
AASRLLELLSVLRAARDAPGLLAAFQPFAEALLLLSGLAAERVRQLRDCPAGKSLARSLRLLHGCVPLIHGALRHPGRCRADLSRDPAFQLAESSVRELLPLLAEPQDESGVFSQQLSKLRALLSHPHLLCRSEGGLSPHLEGVILHGMLLAESSRQDLQLELLERCWALLQLRSRICSRRSPGERQGEPGLERECHSLREHLAKLERAALRATLCQILEGFFQEKEPLGQLVEAALSLAASGCFPAGPGGVLRKLQPLIAACFAQAQRMLRAADLVLARCAKAQTAWEIREGVGQLRSLVASVPSLLTETSQNSTEQLQALRRAWAGAADGLLRCFEETLGVGELLELSVLELAEHKERCQAALEGRDARAFSWHAARLAGWARWVAGAGARHVDGAADPIFRNGLLVWVEQLARSTLELGAVRARVAGRFCCPRSREAFCQAASSLLDSALRVRAGLDGSNHPDILSPLRQRVRSSRVEKGPELSPTRAGTRASRAEAALQGDLQSQPAATFQLDPRTGDTHPVVAALLGASRGGDVDAVRAACSVLLELSRGCVEAAREALPVAEPPQLRVLRQHRDITALTARIVRLAMETAPGRLLAPGGLLRMALELSARIQDVQECLAAVAGSWNGLAQQALGFILAGDVPRGKQALDETLLRLAGAVQVAGGVASMACRRENPNPPRVQESFLQLQAKFSRAQLSTKAFLEKAASFRGSCGTGKALLELQGVRWAVGMRVLLEAVDQLAGRDVLLLRELSRAVRSRVGPRSLLAAVAENSVRLQEAARLSCLSCPADRGAGEMLALREEIQALMEALLDVSNSLLLSPLPAAGLAVRFELLRRDMALRAEALLLRMERVNVEQLQLIRGVLGAAQSSLSREERERSKAGFEEKANQLMAGVQRVRNSLRDALEAGAQLPSQPDLLSMADHLLLLTADVDTGDPCRDTGDPCPGIGDPSQDTGDPHLDSMVWYWSAKAHYLVTQLRVIHGIDRDILAGMREHV